MYRSALVSIVLSAWTPLCAAPYSHNLVDALAAFDQAESPRALFLGDSLTFRERTFYLPLREMIQNDRGNGGAGWQSMSLWTGGGFDPDWIRGQVNADSVPHRSIDGLWGETSSTGWARLDPEAGTKRMRFIVNGTGTFHVWNPAAGTTTLHSAPGVIEALFPLNSGRVFIQPVGNGTMSVLGAWTTNEQPGAIISRGANGGWGVQNFLQRDGTFEQVAGFIDPDLVWIMLGQNDQGYSRTWYATRMAELVDRVRLACPGAGVVLCSSYDSGSQPIAMLADAVYDAAVAKGTGYVNLWAAGGPYSHFEDNGLLEDGVHFSTAGGLYVAQILYDAIRSHGASLRWCAGDVNQDGRCDGRDLSVLLAQFGEKPEPFGPGDLNGDATVNGADLSALLGSFGCVR